MMRVQEVAEEAYTTNETINSAVDSVNRAGLRAIIERDTGSTIGLPMSVVMPLGVDAGFKELAETSGVVLQYGGFANRHDLPDRLVSMTLAATALQKPFIGLPYPNRNWRGDTPPTYSWRGLSDGEKVATSMSLLDAYSEQTIGMVAAKYAVTKAYFNGSSMGAAQALSAANIARQAMDVGGVSVAALPNNEKRLVYPEMLMRDFRKGFDHARREMTAATSDHVRVEPLLEAFGVSEEPRGSMAEVSALCRYVGLDIFGKKLQNYKGNMAFARSISVPSSAHLLDRLGKGDKPVATHLGFFALDPVARIDAFLDLTSEREFDTVEIDVYPEKTHSSCINPLIGTYIALKLLDPTRS